MTIDLALVRVAMFADAYGVEPKEVELGEILNAIRNGKYAEKVKRARDLFAGWKAVCPGLDSKESPEAKAYDAFKKTLPAFCVSGTAKSRTEPLEHSGLMQVDLDKLNGALKPLREKLKGDIHVALGYVSPSGEGLKMGLAIDGTRHTESFEAAQHYFRQQYGVEIDPAVRDRLRLCFVSSDSEAWTNPAAVPLPLPAAVEAGPPTEAEDDAADPEVEAANNAEVSGIILPSGDVSISDSARAIFRRIGPSQTLFWRGGALVELVVVDGITALGVVKPDAFRTRVEKFGSIFAYRAAGEGVRALKPAKLSLDDARAIMAATEAREFLPTISSVLRCPVLIETGSGEVVILGRGYHEENGGLLILAGDTPPQVPVAVAAEALRWLVTPFHFQTEGDRSRAVAALITPALRMGGFICGPIPVDVAEADQPQAGKGYRLTLVAALYNEASYFVTARNGGVGGVDESFATALISGRPFICLDNFRGKLDSQYLEAFLTSPGLFPARIPHHGEVLVDPRRVIIQLSSNGLEATRDFAKRGSLCRILKRPGFPSPNTLAEVRRRQPYFLGCVFSLVADWISKGKPRTKDTRHDFGEWSQILDAFMGLIGCAPLMDGHAAAQERVSKPALSWLRVAALAVEADNCLGRPLVASDLAELCDTHGIEIPGKPLDEERAKRQIGILAKQIFRDGDSVEVDGFTVTRGRREYRKPSGDLDHTNSYTFLK